MAAASQRRLRVVGFGFMLGPAEEEADFVRLLTHATLLVPAVGLEKLNAKTRFEESVAVCDSSPIGSNFCPIFQG